MEGQVPAWDVPPTDIRSGCYQENIPGAGEGRDQCLRDSTETLTATSGRGNERSSRNTRGRKRSLKGCEE